MLVLSRRLFEKVVIPETQVSVQVAAIKPGVVRLAFQAPPEVTILREEVYLRRQEWQADASTPPERPGKLGEISRLFTKRLQMLASGLKVLGQQLQAGAVLEAMDILNEVHEDVELLQQRLVNEMTTESVCEASRRALVVEDNENERELLANCLRRSGLTVDTAGDGGAALDYLQSQARPDVVLLDMGLPRCDGQTAVKAIRSNPAYAGLKIFAVTGHLPDEFDLAIGPTGVDQWFHKPLNVDVLIQNLKKELP
jgi:carbon storage regulator CsrA